MHENRENEFRHALEDAPPRFLDRVDTPWDQVPDFPEFNQHAYKHIARTLAVLSRSTGDESHSNTQGMLVLGEAGTGKTHLLMRVARKLSDSNHILFIRKPNNEEAVGQHVWHNVVNSLAKSLPTSGVQRSQLDDLLAHVFSDVLVPEFERDIREGTDVDQRQRWVDCLRRDPFSLFSMLGDGEKRQDNMEKIRRRTLRYLHSRHPDVDQTIARVLITYCFVSREDRKRVLLTWLSGQDVNEAEAQDLGLPPSWVRVDETSTDASVQQQREEQALRAIRSIGILSTHYQPLILAFDQLEGLRDQPRLTQRWGDTVREIFTMTPNLLIVTCIFPSLWRSWFGQQLDRSVAERIAQQTVDLESFEPRHGVRLLETQLRDSFTKHRLPDSIYPFTHADVELLCRTVTSPRSFIQAARSAFMSWLDHQADASAASVVEATAQVVSQEAIDNALASALAAYAAQYQAGFDRELPMEQDFFGRIKNVCDVVLSSADEQVQFAKATLAHYVMPTNFVIRSRDKSEALCIAVANSTGNAFAARMRNLLASMRDATQFTHVLLVRDQRCKQTGARSQQYMREIGDQGGVIVLADRMEMLELNSHYDTLIAVEEHAITVGAHQVDKRQFAQNIRTTRSLGRTQVFRHAARLIKAIARATGLDVTPTSDVADAPSRASQPSHVGAVPTIMGPWRASPRDQPPIAVKKFATPPRNWRSVTAQLVIGDTDSNSPNMGVIGVLKDDNRRLAISWNKPQCAVVLGYMGSGKSYALGVLMENALLAVPGVIHQTQPMSVVAFNFRRNPESRFEYGGFAVANDHDQECMSLRSQYGAEPQAVKTVNVFGYEEEIPRRHGDYDGMSCYPIQFRPDELSAEHWEILMKPPSPQSEYMDIVRNIIQKLFYQERLTYKNLEKQILSDERLSDSQRRRAMNRMSFAQRWISDTRAYDWEDVLTPGSLNVFDLRMQAMDSAEALKLCLIVTDLVRRTRNGVNKVVVFDEAHEYVDCKELVKELENSITQIRHDGLSFVLASQFPEKIPEQIFKYLLTRFIFKLPSAKAINFVRRSAPHLAGLSPELVSNLDLEQGMCFVQTDDDCTDAVLRSPQAHSIRPRCTRHGGATLRNVSAASPRTQATVGTADDDNDAALDDSEAETCPKCGKTLIVRKGPLRLFLGCSAYPACRYTRDFDS